MKYSLPQDTETTNHRFSTNSLKNLSFPPSPHVYPTQSPNTEILRPPTRATHSRSLANLSFEASDPECE